VPLPKRSASLSVVYAKRALGQICTFLLDGLDTYIPYDMITWILSQTRRLYPQVVGPCPFLIGELNVNDA